MNDPNQPINPVPLIPQTPVTVQSLTPTGLTGQVMPPSARTASGSIPAHALPPPPPIEVGVLEPEYAHAAEYQEAMPYVEPAHPPRRSMFARYWDKIGGGSLTLSILIHGGLIALFIMIVYTTTIEKQVDFLPGGGSKQGNEASQNLAHQVQQKKRTNINKSTPKQKLVSSSQNAAISIPDIPIQNLDVSDIALPSGSSGGGLGGGGAGGGWGNGIGRGGQSGFSPMMPPSMKQRCSSVERLQKLRESGGTPDCEKAVSTALEYLKSKQNPDGSWGKTNKGAMTGFALLCFLGRCETPDSLYYGDNVMKGLLYLVELSKKNPEGIMCEKMAANAVPYEHGIATYAMGEMYSLARLGGKPLPGVKDAYEQGVKTIMKYQHASGSWVYGAGNYAPSGREDLSVTGWQYQALKSAKLSGLKFDKLHGSIEKTVKYLQSKQTADGGFGTNKREGSYNQWDLSGVGILGLQTLGQGKSADIKKGIKFASELFEKEPPEWNSANLYAWYYYAQAFFQDGGPEWKRWNETALPLLLKNQKPDGSWLAPTNKHNATAGGDNIYPTALCTLMLEVYYRYLKVGDRESTSSSLFDRK